MTGVAVDDGPTGLRRRLLPPLSRPLWLLQAGGLVNAVGDGLVLPFLVIYLHNVRSIGLATAGLITVGRLTAGVIVERADLAAPHALD